MFRFCFGKNKQLMIQLEACYYNCTERSLVLLVGWTLGF